MIDSRKAAGSSEPGTPDMMRLWRTPLERSADSFIDSSAKLSAESTILYAPGMETLARELRDTLDLPLALCTSEVSVTELVERDFLHRGNVCWDRFPSDDPNVKLRVDCIRDKHIIFLMNMEQPKLLFDQLSVLLFLQRFVLPEPDQKQADEKWKRTIKDSAYDTCSVKSIRIIVPWCRYCQMERTCRWTILGDKWFNGDPAGAFVDVPTLLSLVELLAAAPSGSAQPVQRRILFIDIHEYVDLEVSAVICCVPSCIAFRHYTSFDQPRGVNTKFDRELTT